MINHDWLLGLSLALVGLSEKCKKYLSCDAKSPSCLSYKPGTWVNLFSQPWCRGLSAPSGPAIHPLLQVLYRHRWQTAVCEASTFPFAAETLHWGSFFTKSIKDANPNKNICFTFPITNTFLQTRKSAVKSVSKFHLFFRFQSEAQLAKFGINQSGIYKSPITRFNPTPKSTIFRYNHQSTNTRYKHQSPGAYNQSWRKSSFDGLPLHCIRSWSLTSKLCFHQDSEPHVWKVRDFDKSDIAFS